MMVVLMVMMVLMMIDNYGAMMMALFVIMRMTKKVITPLITQVFKRAGGNGSQTYHVVFILTLAPTILRWDVDMMKGILVWTLDSFPASLTSVYLYILWQS